jgi:F-type H+-transporting ATPase subunit delta
VSDIKARPDKIARRYGGVLFDLAHKDNTINVVLKDLKLLQRCVTAEPLEWSRVVSPSLPLHTQRQIIASLLASLKLGTLMSHFLMTLCQNRRLPHLNLILEEFLERSQRARGIVEGALETTIPLSNKEIETLQNTLQSRLGENILLHQEVKEHLLGGMILRIGSLMIDASTKTRLNKLRMTMKG